MDKKRLIYVLLITILAVSVVAGMTACKPKEAKVLRVGTEGAFPPFNYIDENNELVGFEIDFARAIAESMGYEPEFITSEWSGILTSLLANKYDVIIASMTILPEREEQVNFSEWYYVDGDILTVNEDNTDINGKEDLDGKVVGATTGTTQETLANDICAEYGCEVKLYPSDVEGVSDLASKRVDAFIGAQIQMNYRASANDEAIKTVGERLNDSYKGAAFRKEDTELLAEFDKAFQGMLDDGSYEKLSNEWFGFNAHED